MMTYYFFQIAEKFFPSLLYELLKALVMKSIYWLKIIFLTLLNQNCLGQVKNWNSFLENLKNLKNFLRIFDSALCNWILTKLWAKSGELSRIKLILENAFASFTRRFRWLSLEVFWGRQKEFTSIKPLTCALG